MSDKGNYAMPLALYAYVKSKEYYKKINKPKLTDAKRAQLRKKRKRKKRSRK